MNVISGAACRKYLNFIFARDPAEIAMKPLPYFVPDERSPFCGSKDDVDQATYVTMRHGFSRPFGTYRYFDVYPGLRPGLSSAVPSGLARRVEVVYSGLKGPEVISLEFTRNLRS